MRTDDYLGGRKEIVSNSGQFVISNSNKIVLSLERYLGNIFPRIKHVKLDNYIDMNIYTKEYL